jgi:hypothetical protein
MAVKLRYLRNGALVGGVILAFNIVVGALRGSEPVFAEWQTPTGLGHNFGYLLAIIGLPALIGFIIGCIADFSSRKKRADQA